MKKTLIGILTFALAIACVCAISSQTNAATVASGTCGDKLTWTLDNTGRLAITGSGAMKDYTYSSRAPWHSNLSKIKTVIIGNYVTSIGNYAFYECTYLESVTIGFNVKTIGAEAFYDCRELTSVTIPDRVTTIGSEAFNRCRTLTSVTIGSSVESIGASAFDYCDSLTDVYITDPSAWCKIQFGDDYHANPMNSADHLHILDEEGKEVTELVLDNTVTAIPDSAFQNCDDLTSITIPGSVTAIGEYAFSQCDSLDSVTLPVSIESIGKYAFDDCFNLSYVYYAGTESQWNQISIGSENGRLITADIHFNHIHDYSLLSPVIKEPTCTEAGYIEYLCIYGDARRETLPAVEHQPGVILETVPPTCAEQGRTLFTCRFCEQTFIQLAYALGHDFTGPVKTLEPTCTETGHFGPSCTRCDAIRNDQPLDSLGHKMVLVPAVDPTCTEPGLTAGTQCERCQQAGVAQEVVPAAGHSFANGACTICGEPEYTPGNLDGIEGINEDDAIYLLCHVLMPSAFPVDQDVDLNNDGTVNEDDAIYLLRHVLMPNLFPL